MFPPFLAEFLKEMTSIATVIRFEGQWCNVPEHLVEHGLCIRESSERSQYKSEGRDKGKNFSGSNNFLFLVWSL